MENALKLQLRWEKMSSKPKWRYILLEVVLQRFVLITVVVSLLNAILFQEFFGQLRKMDIFCLVKTIPGRYCWHIGRFFRMGFYKETGMQRV